MCITPISGCLFLYSKIHETASLHFMPFACSIYNGFHDLAAQHTKYDKYCRSWILCLNMVVHLLVKNQCPRSSRAYWGIRCTNWVTVSPFRYHETNRQQYYTQWGRTMLAVCHSTLCQAMLAGKVVSVFWWIIFHFNLS